MADDITTPMPEKNGSGSQGDMRDMFKKLVGEEGAVGETFRAQLVPLKMNIKGTMILMGGAVGGESIVAEMRDKDAIRAQDLNLAPEYYDPTGLYRKMFADYDLKNKNAVVITSPFEKPQTAIEVGEDTRELFHLLGAKAVHVIDTHDPAKFDSEANLKALRETRHLFISGGDQKRIADLLEGTKAKEIILRRIKEDPDFLYSGTSAGAAVVSGPMVYIGRQEKGLGIVDYPIDMHFLQRNGRKERLNNLVMNMEARDMVGVGIDEGAAIKITGNTLSPYGWGKTLNEWRRDEHNPKYVTIFTKSQGADGKPVIDHKQYVCDSGQCFLRFDDKPASNVINVPLVVPNVSVNPPVVVPPGLPMEKTPMQR